MVYFLCFLACTWACAAAADGLVFAVLYFAHKRQLAHIA